MWDKFKETRLTPRHPGMWKAPGVEESPVNIECKVVEVEGTGKPRYVHCQGDGGDH